jgi:arginyl-tRNA synthetase
LAKACHHFYNQKEYRIITEEDEVKKAFFTVIADITRRNLTAALNTLGIEVPERM